MAKKQEQPDGLQSLKQAIRTKDPGRLYFFYGEEVFLLHHYLQQLQKVIIDELTESFNYHKLTSETFDIREFADCVENLPMMAERTMVVVDEIDIFKMNESDREKMTDILSDIPEYCTVVFTYETTSFKPDKRLKKLWEAISKNGELIEFAKLHESVFRDEAAATAFAGSFSSYHVLLRAQLAQPLRKFCGSDFSAEFIAEALLSWTMAGKSFDDIYGMIEKLF